MDHSMLVHKANGLQNLLSEALNLKLCQPLATFDLFVKGGVAAKLHYYVNVLFVLKEVFELDDVGMMHASVNPDLALQFLFSARLRQRGLRHNFDSLQMIQLEVPDFVDFSEAALA